VRVSTRAGRQVSFDPPAEERHGALTLGYMPALDGLRAVAVLSVMAYHGGVSFMTGGFFGVDAFFVLSGFLITSLLVTEWSRTQTVALGRFWSRRARRLLPALIAIVLFVLVYARFVAAPGTYPGLRWDGLSALFYSANWRFIFAGQSYFAQAAAVSPLQHTWSLAIEEQFYILWPLAVVAVMSFQTRRRREGQSLRPLFLLSVIGAFASAVEMAILYHPGQDPTRIYFGTDTHAQCLLVGAALATGRVLWSRRAPTVEASPVTRRLVAATGIGGAAVFVWACTQLHYGQTLVFRGGFLIVAVSVAAVIAHVAGDARGPLSRALAWGPLRYVGRISYGMYLWHFPLFIVIDADRTGLEGWALLLVRSSMTIAVASASFYFLERPIRIGGLGSALARRIVTPAAMVGSALAIVALTASTATATTGVSADSRPSRPLSQTPTRLADAPVRVLLVGDSVAFSLGLGLDPSVDARWHVVEADLGTLGCGVMPGFWAYSDVDGAEVQTLLDPSCASVPFHGAVPYPRAWRSWLRETQANVVVLLAGRWEVTDRPFHGKISNILHPAFAAFVKKQLEDAVIVGTSTGARMVLMTAPCFDQGEQANGTPFPEDDPRRVLAYNRLVREVAAEFPKRVVLQDLYSMACPGGRFQASVGGVSFRPDGVHFDFSGRQGLGSALLAPRILPLWEQLGHEQEAAGGKVVRTPMPAHFSRP